MTATAPTLHLPPARVRLQEPPPAASQDADGCVCVDGRPPQVWPFRTASQVDTELQRWLRSSVVWPGHPRYRAVPSPQDSSMLSPWSPAHSPPLAATNLPSVPIVVFWRVPGKGLTQCTAV